jgi:hypothetical protein
MLRVKKDRSTPEKEKFWKSIEAAVEEIRSWPEWKQNYISPLLLQDKQKNATQTTKSSMRKK